MNEVSFVERRNADWQKLSALSDKAEYGIRQLNSVELQEFVRTYRRVCADLAVARTQSNNLELIEFLNDLTARAYSVLYREPRKGFWGGLKGAVEHAARTVRKLKAFVALSAGIFLFGVLFAYFALRLNPQALDAIVPPGLMRSNFESWKTGDFDSKTLIESLAMTNFYAANNPVVALQTGATAAGTFGLTTVYSLYQNGLLMGALIHELQPVGRVGYLLLNVSPHGVTEISGIVIAGAAGLHIGWSILAPGRRKRGDALAEAARDGIVVLVVGVLMMYLAAPIEGFFSFNASIPDWLKLAFSLASAIAWFLFWTSVGRLKDGQAQ